jgi:mRNA interferase HicA
VCRPAADDRTQTITRHSLVYTEHVKRRDLERRLKERGWRFLRSGGRHDVWTNGEREEAVPRHREINERLAQAILRRACRG